MAARSISKSGVIISFLRFLTYYVSVLDVGISRSLDLQVGSHCEQHTRPRDIRRFV